MSHVAPHKWADAFAGKLDEAERDAMDRHADECPRCKRARGRVQTASASFPALRAQSAPELGWDSIRARVHWSVSTERYARVRLPRRRLAWGLASVGIAAGVAGVALVRHHHDHAAGVTSPPVAARVVLPAPPTVETAIVSRLAGDVMVDGVRVHADDGAFARSLGAGTVIATGTGRLDAQFGEASAFALGPRSTLELRRFDADVIELAVDGTVDVEVAPRAKGQRFLVDAGDRVVEVRGTRFQVRNEAGAITVECQHGLVAVRDASGEALVASARKAVVPAGHTIVETHAVPMSAAELAELGRTAPWATPGWTADLGARTAPLVIATAAARAVRVDGVELGAAPFAVRVTPGRHTVEAVDTAGRYRRAGWVDVGIGGANATRFEVASDPAADVPISPSATQLRKRQLATGVDRARLAQCTRPIAKQGLTDYVQIEIAIDAAGAVSFLNVLDTDLPEATADCVHDALAPVHFGAGPAATWRQKISL